MLSRPTRQVRTAFLSSRIPFLMHRARGDTPRGERRDCIFLAQKKKGIASRSLNSYGSPEGKGPGRAGPGQGQLSSLLLGFWFRSFLSCLSFSFSLPLFSVSFTLFHSSSLSLSSAWLSVCRSLSLFLSQSCSGCLFVSSLSITFPFFFSVCIYRFLTISLPLRVCACLCVCVCACL